MMKIRLSLLWFTLLMCNLSLHAKDHVWDRYWATREYLCTRFGIGGGNKDIDFELADAFMRMYKNKEANITHQIMINQEGRIMYDGEEVSIDAARSLILSPSNLVSKPVLFFTVTRFSKKSDRILQKLMKSVTKLIAAREALSYTFDAYPVLCTNEKMGGLIKERLDMFVPPPPPPTQQTISATSSSPKTPARKAPAVQYQVRSVKTATLGEEGAQIGKRKETWPPTSANTYIVNVETSLTIREGPSIGAKKLGSLVRGERVKVIGSEGDWAQIVYGSSYAYVKASYLKPETSNVTQKRLLDERDIYRILYYVFPYVILGLALLLLFSEKLFESKSAIKGLFFFLGLIEFLFCVIKEEIDPGVNPWFCEPGEVGWIMTVVNYLILLGILMFQHEAFKTFVGSFQPGCFGCIAAYVLTIAVGISLLAFVKAPTYFFITPIVLLGISWYVLYKWGNESGNALGHTLWCAVTFGGFAVFFINMLGLLIMGGLLFLLFQAFIHGSSPSSSSANEPYYPEPDVYDDGGTPHYFKENNGGFHASDEQGRSWKRDFSTGKWERDD